MESLSYQSGYNSAQKAKTHRRDHHEFGDEINPDCIYLRDACQGERRC